jgi:hypothetical protein
MSDLPNIPTDRITEELQKLYQLFQAGALNADEYAQAKAKILNSADVNSEAVNVDTQIQLLRVEMDNALLRAEQDWEVERESLLIYPKDGRPVEPSDGDVVVAVLISVLFVIAIIFMIANRAVSSAETVLMVIALAVGAVAFPVYAKSRLANFRQAEDAYRMRRSNIYDHYDQRIQALKARQ